MINLISSTKKEYNLEKWKLFNLYYNSLNTYTKVVLDQINNRLYDKIIPQESDLTIIDLGSNIGLVSLYLKDIAKILFSVEPTPEHYIALCEMIGTFSCNNIVPINMAVALKTEFRSFILEGKNTTMNRLGTKRRRKHIQVPCLSMVDFFEKYNIKEVDFIKIDIEGGEVEIADSLIDLPIKRIYMECHKHCFGFIKEKLEKKYKIEKIGNGFLAIK